MSVLQRVENHEERIQRLEHAFVSLADHKDRRFS